MKRTFVSRVSSSAFAVVVALSMFLMAGCPSDGGDGDQGDDGSQTTTSIPATDDGDGTGGDGDGSGDDGDGTTGEDDDTTGDDDDPDETSDPEDGPPLQGDALLDRLKANAEQFEYAIGEYGGTLSVASISEPLTFNLAISKDAGSSGALSYLFEGLTEISWLDDQVEPALAESWEHSDDGLTWKFNIRRDVTWHDGEPFTAHDVDFTFNKIIYNEDILTSARAAFEFRFPGEDGEWETSPMTVTAIDDHTVVFVLPVSFAPFLRSMGQAIYPKHILEQYVDDGTFNEIWGIDTDPTEIIGTGPFTIESYTPGERLTFVRNPNYWKTDAEGNRLPYIDRVVDVIVDDLEAILEEFRAGRSDLHSVLGSEYAELLPVQEEENFSIHRRGPGFGTTFLTFNVNPGQNPETDESYVNARKLGWFSNVEFRRAVAHSVNKEMIIEDVQHGLGYSLWSDISPSSAEFHNPDVREYPYDLQKANEILDTLGWVDTDEDGIREDSDGNEIEFKLITNEGNSVRQEIGQIIHDGMTAIGLKVEYEAIDFGVLVDKLTTTYDWESLIIGFTGGPDPYGGITFWHSNADLHLWNPGQVEPATDWEAEIDELYVKASQELDHDLRVSYYHRAQEIAAEYVPIIYTSQSERLTAIRNIFGNTIPTLYGIWDIRYLYLTEQ